MIQLLIDTNTLLHYKRIDKIDWLKLIGVSEVEIILAPIVVRELEKHKTFHQIKKLRERANGYIKWINSLLINSLECKIKKGCYMRCLHNEPLLDFKAYHLQREVADDVLIGHAIELSKDNRLIVITADIGIRLKCVAYNIEVISLDENDYKLPIEEDEDKKRIRELEKLNQEMKNRLPVINVQFENGKNHFEYKLCELAETEINNKLDEEWNRYKPGRRTFGAAGMALAEQYDYIVRKYYEEYEKYLNDVSYFNAHVVKLDFIVANTGNNVADDVRIEFLFPENLVVQVDYDLPCEPDPPRIPARGENPYVDITKTKRDYLLLGLNKNGSNIKGPHMLGNGKVNYGIERVMHNIPVELPSL